MSNCWSPNLPLAGRSIKDDAELSELARKELDIVAAAARAVEVFGAAGGAQLHHLDVPIGVGHARGGNPAQGGGAARSSVSGDEPYAPVGIVPLFETIDDLQRGSSILEAVLDLPLYRAIVTARGEARK